MTAVARVPVRRMAAALVVWFAHFMLCWAVAEFGPGGAPAAGLAGLFTVLALFAIGVQAWRLRGLEPRREDDLTALRIARGASAIAAVAVVFTALPALVWRG